MKREVILKDFFKHHGWIADITSDYMYYIRKIEYEMFAVMHFPQYSEEECKKNGYTYEYRFESNKYNFTIPAMTAGGYFIIEGADKVMLIQELRLKTEPYVYKLTRDEIVCELNIENNKHNVPIKIMLKNGIIELNTIMIHKNLKNCKSIGIYEILIDMFLSEYDEEERSDKLISLMQSYIEDEDLFSNCIIYIMSSVKGAQGITKREYIEIIRNKIFNGMSNLNIVATLITMIVMCINMKFNNIVSYDRDSYCMKRLRTPGNVIYESFGSCTYEPKLLQGDINKKIYKCLKRGEVYIGGRIYNNMSIQLLKRSFIDKISSVRKVIVPCDENSSNLQVRQIHHSQRGYICPCETPEGKSVGLSKSLACCCLITTDTDISEWTRENCTDKFDKKLIWVIINGSVVGWCNSNQTSIIKKKYPTVSVTMPAHNVIKIRTTSGRPIRPLLVNRNHPFDWNIINKLGVGNVYLRLVEEGYMEYVDPVEAHSCNIASMNYQGDWKRFKYMEIHPSMMLGIAASLIPFPEHNQSARNVFSSSMVKQAMHMYGYEKVCNYLQKPIVSTFIGRTIGLDDNPNGLNLIVAIMSIEGYNQEDAIIVKKSCIERGMFSTISTYSTSITVDKPYRTVNDKDKLTVVSGGIEKSVVTASSMLMNPKVVKVSSKEVDIGKEKLEIKMQDCRNLELGDKLASRHSQKGVIGHIMPEIDMPFTKDGITPDIIINPHAIPSRMTVGQLIESALGKSCCINGTFADGTPFIRNNKEDLMNITDEEYVTLGTTGEMVKTPIAIGVVYYLPLKHQAADKIYFRGSSGSKSLLSRQPISGRSKGGGLRIGEMEYDCLIAYGASKLIKEVSEHSDITEAPYCYNCNIVTDVFNDPCKYCNEKVGTKDVPFSYVVLKDLMLAANIQI